MEGQSIENSIHSLWVGDLHTDVEESDLRSIFTNAFRIRLCRNITSNSSLGQAYLDYHREADAVAAIEKFNGFMMKDQRIRVMWSSNTSHMCILYVKNLATKTNHCHLYSLFAAHGTVKKIQIQKKNGICFAFVHYVSPEGAKYALIALNHSAMSFKVEAYKTKEEVEQNRVAKRRRAAEKFAESLGLMNLTGRPKNHMMQPHPHQVRPIYSMDETMNQQQQFAVPNSYQGRLVNLRTEPTVSNTSSSTVSSNSAVSMRSKCCK